MIPANLASSTVYCEQFSKLNEQFFITHCCFIPSHVNNAYLFPTSKFILISGNLQLDHDLNLDWGPFEVLFEKNPNEISGLIVIGDLIINGDLLNTDIDNGPLLMVRGNLVANNLYSGGSTIIVGRDASVRDLVFGNYNHGELIVMNDLHVGMLVMRDHCFSAEKIQATHAVDDDTDLEFDSEDASENLQRINDRLEVAIQDVDELGSYLSQRTSILKPGSRNTHKLKPTVFPTTAEEVILFVQTQQRVFSGDIPLQLHQDRDFMLRLCAMHPDIFSGLKNRWHLSADFMAAALDSGSLEVSNYIKFVEDQSTRQQLINKFAKLQ